MAAISQAVFSGALLWMKSFVFFIQISQKFVPDSELNNNPVLAQVMAWRRTCPKPISQPMVTQFTDAYMRH